MNFTGLNDAVFQDFGENLVFTTAAGNKSLTAIIIRPSHPLARHMVAANPLGHSVMRPEDVIVSARSTDVVTAGIEVQNTTTIDGRSFWVVQLWPDDAGVTAMELRP